MSSTNNIFNNYISSAPRFADCINTSTGEALINPDYLHDADIGPVKNFINGHVPYDRTRTCMKFYGIEKPCILLGVESMYHIRPSISIKNFISCAYSYDQQLDATKQYHKSTKDTLRGNKILSFSNNDRIIPIMNFFVYYGEEPWNASTNIQELMNFNAVPEISHEAFKKLLADYRIFVLDIKHMEQVLIDNMKSDLRHLFGLIRCSPEKNTMLEYIVENKHTLSAIDDGLFNAVAAMTGLPELYNSKNTSKNTDGSINLMKAFVDIYLN